MCVVNGGGDGEGGWEEWVGGSWGGGAVGRLVGELLFFTATPPPRGSPLLYSEGGSGVYKDRLQEGGGRFTEFEPPTPSAPQGT